MNFRTRIWRKSRWRMSCLLFLCMIECGQTDTPEDEDNAAAIVNAPHEFVETRSVTVDCNGDHMCVHVPIALDDFDLPDCLDQQGQKFCTRDLKGCGTNFNVLNDTHVLYSNQVPYGERSLITWKCIYPLETIANLNLTVQHKSAQMKEIGIITQAPAGAGRFYISFQLFSDESYKHPFGFRPHLSRDGIMRGRVTLHNHTSLSRATVQLTRCWATPEADGQGGFDLIRNFCPVKSGADVQLVNSGTSYFATFESGVFKFTKSDSVYLHCHVRICFQHETDSENCVINPSQCGGFERERRSLETTPDATISIGPISVAGALVIQDLQQDGAFFAREIMTDLEPDNKIRIDPAVLWSLLAALMAAAVGLALILIYWLREDRKKSLATNILKNSNRGSISSVETA